MKIHVLPALLLTVVLAGTSMPLAYADGVQKDTPGAQGLQGSDPTRQDQDVTGPNGEHPANTNPDKSLTSTHHKKHHKKTCTTSTSSDSTTSGK
jgi:hypothetical protein